MPSIINVFCYRFASLNEQKTTKYLENNYFFSFTVPPTSIEIVDHPAGSRVKIRENEEVELTCKVANAKPKADIVWYRKDSQFVTGKPFPVLICLPKSSKNIGPILSICVSFAVRSLELINADFFHKWFHYDGILIVIWLYFKMLEPTDHVNFINQIYTLHWNNSIFNGPTFPKTNHFDLNS